MNTGFSNRRRCAILFLGGTLGMSACGSGLPRTAASAPAGSPAKVLVARHVAVLAADSMLGRFTPSRGLEMAAGYSVAHLRELGWAPLGDAGTYLQHWAQTVTRLDARRTTLSATGCGQSAQIRIGADFAAMYGDPGHQRGRAVFLDSVAENSAELARDEIAVIRTADPNPMALAHRVMGPARSAGIKALVVVTSADAPDSATLRTAENAARMDHSASGVPIAIVSHTAWQPLEGVLQQCGQAALALHTPAYRDSAMVPNVVALLPGRDPVARSEYVVVSAHLDHNGVGVPDASGDSIYNGADDNASGVAVVLVVARALAEAPPRRSVVILLPSGEEQGSRGSAHFVAHAPIDMKQVVANVNVDGVGRAWQKDTVSAIGYEYSSLGPLVAGLAESHPELKLTVAVNQWPNLAYFRTSDQISFATAGIPSIFFSSTGPDPHYHRPSDSAATLDFDHLARVAELVHLTVRSVADAVRPPVWDPAARAAIVQRQ